MQSSPIHTKSSGNLIPFIQNEDACPLWNMKSIPVCSARLSRPPSPLLRSSGVSAISAPKTESPIDILGPAGVGTGVGDGTTVAVGGGVGVTVGGSTVIVGVRVAIPVAVAIGIAVAVYVEAGAGITAEAATDVLVAVASAMAVGCNVSSGGSGFSQAAPTTIATPTNTDKARTNKMLRQVNQSRAVAAALACFRLERASERVSRQMFAHSVA